MCLRTLVVGCCLGAIVGDAPVAKSQIGMGRSRQAKAEAQGEKSAKAESKTPGATAERRRDTRDWRYPRLLPRTFDTGEICSVRVVRPN
jgi:hypothetical protein